MNRRWREGRAMVLADEHGSTAFLDIDSTLGRPHAKTMLAGLHEFDVRRLPGRRSRFRCWAKVGDQAVVYQGNSAEVVCWIPFSSYVLWRTSVGLAAGHCGACVYSVSFILSFCQRFNYRPSHPNIIQIYGTVHSGGVYATLYHDGALFAWNVVLIWVLHLK
jgi:hypothetical protein